MRAVLFFIGLFYGLSASAQQIYPVASIAPGLLSRAGAVVRNSSMVIDVKAPDNVFYRMKYAVTILNASAADEAGIDLYYDKDSQIRSVKGVIYNELGLAVSKFSEKNFEDRSAVSSISLYEDNRVKRFNPANVSYPFTIEYEYEIRTKQSLYFPSWQPVQSTGVAIESSDMTFICPVSTGLRFKEYNYPGKAEISLAGDIKTYKWQVKNINARKAEPYSPHSDQFLVSVKFAPTQFTYGGTNGTFSNWQEYGKWVSDNLLKGRDQVSESTKAYILSLIEECTDPKEKAKKIYEYVQNKTRYISVQIGIGGYRPYPASEVDRLSYGDCKGLVNYTAALLKLAGIESYYTVVYGGDFKRDIISDFASMQGNHAILCLPFKNDTTWLECTSKTAPFGFAGDFTDDRDVIVCTPEGGKIMHTSRLAAPVNRQIRTARFAISENGDLSGDMLTQFEGLQYDNRSYLLDEAYSEQLKKLPEVYPFPNLNVESFSIKQDKSLKPVTTESIKFRSDSYCSAGAEKMILALNRVNVVKNPPKEVARRLNQVLINRGYYDEDSLTFTIPARYKTAALPLKRVIEKPFGKYTSVIAVKGNDISYIRTMQLNEGIYKPELYEELVDFFQQIADADSMKIVLDAVKKI